jgi:hypothetical protein
MPEPSSIDRESEDAMNKPMTTLGAAAAGALAMYYLDPDLGERRRALLVDLVRNGLPPKGERAAVSGVGPPGSRSPTPAATPTCAAASSRGSEAW